MKTFIIFFTFCNIVFAQNISIKIDLGGNEFEYLEQIYAKIKITNNDRIPIRIHKSYTTYGPDVSFILKNENDELFDYTGEYYDLATPEYEIFYILAPGESREFPLLGGYYFLKDYYKVKTRFYRYLPIGLYKIKAKLRLESKLYESDYTKFSVFAAKDTKALKLFDKCMNNYWTMKQFKDTYYLFEQFAKQYPNSIYNVLSIPYIDNLLNFGKNDIENTINKKDALRTRVFSLLKDKFPDTRMALVETKWLLIGTAQDEKQEFFERACSELKNKEFIESLKALINKELPEDLKIEKVKNKTNKPPIKK